MESAEKETSSKLARDATSTKESLLKLVKVFIVFSGALALLCTLTGAYYHYGQLSEFNLPESVFPLQVHETPTLVHRALISIAGNFLAPAVDSPLLIGASALAAFIAALAIWAAIAKAHSPATQVFNQWWGRRLRRPIVLSTFGGAWVGLVLYLTPRVLLLLSAAVLFTPLAGYYAGKSDARNFVSKRQPCSTSKEPEVSTCSTLTFLRDEPDVSG